MWASMRVIVSCKILVSMRVIYILSNDSGSKYSVN
jgi:hypothetical protein